MQKFQLSAPCLFGLEGLVADELRRLDMEDVRAENGRVLFSGGWQDVARANLRLRCAERVLILMGESECLSFDSLFESVRAQDWAGVVERGGAFPVKGNCLSSTLHSVPDCQKIIQKAVAESLKAAWGVKGMLLTDGPKYQIRFSIIKDRASVYIDTSGAGLHKRGYRAVSSEAPLRETLAAAMVTLSRYRGRGGFHDPFCGSGTIPIEAAMIALNRAPGLGRTFEAQTWRNVPPKVWEDAAEEARAAEYHGSYDISGSDVDSKNVELSRANAQKCGVAEHIRFSCADALKSLPEAERGVMVTNPPYGQRLLDEAEAASLYSELGSLWQKKPDWGLYLLSAHPDFEQAFGRKAEKKRKLYNGMIKCDLFMYPACFR